MMKSAQAGDAQGSNQRVGQVIKGKWKIESLLGVGGMASVYAAVHRNSQRAALKILHADFAREKTICERFLREAYVSNKVNHSATVQVLDDDMTEQGEPFLIMELLEGETVRDAWKKADRKLDMGKSCIRFKTVDDLALDVLAEALRRMTVKEYVAKYVELLAKQGKGPDGKKLGKAAAKVKATKAPAKKQAKAARKAAKKGGK